MPATSGDDCTIQYIVHDVDRCGDDKLTVCRRTLTILANAQPATRLFIYTVVHRTSCSICPTKAASRKKTQSTTDANFQKPNKAAPGEHSK